MRFDDSRILSYVTARGTFAKIIVRKFKSQINLSEVREGTAKSAVLMKKKCFKDSEIDWRAKGGEKLEQIYKRGSCECRKCVEISHRISGWIETGRVGRSRRKTAAKQRDPRRDEKRRFSRRGVVDFPVQRRRRKGRRRFILAAKTMALNLAECRGEELKSACV